MLVYHIQYITPLMWDTIAITEGSFVWLCMKMNMYLCCHLLGILSNCTSMFVRVNFILTAGLLDWLHGDDPVCACGFFHCGGFHPDGCVGQRQTPRLLKGVQRLSNPAFLHTPLHPVEPGRETSTWVSWEIWAFKDLTRPRDTVLCSVRATHSTGQYRAVSGLQVDMHKSLNLMFYGFVVRGFYVTVIVTYALKSAIQ